MSETHMITGVNHVTLSVSNLARSLQFYVEVVGLTLVATWSGGVYLRAGDDWVCLSLDAETRAGPHAEYTHLAFSTNESSFHDRAALIRGSGVTIWKEDRSEGESLYFLDPDGHKLELHVGDLESRLAALKEQPYEGLQLYV